MSSLKTEHYGLHRWEKDDAVLREEFNENFAAIDAAILAAKEAKPYITGSYVGDGQYGEYKLTTLELGFRPSLVVIAGGELTSAASGTYLVAPSPVAQSYQSSLAVTWTESGVSWYSGYGYSQQMNTPGKRYYYTAFY